MIRISVLAFICISLLSSCDKDDKLDNKSGEFKGAEVTLYEGKAWSVVKVDQEGNPTDLTVILDDAALNSVPVGTGNGGTHNHENSVVLPFHNQVKTITPFKHIGLDYNPDGHEPTAVYGLPHFDFHFYLINEPERLAIAAFEVDSSKFVAIPTQQYIPANYAPIPGGVPQMGTHWVDVTSAELSGQTFTQTFIYGSYNSNVTFYEPMITLDYLKATSEFSRNIPQPPKVKVSGHYPTKMEVRKHNGLTDVTLTSFVYREAE